MHKTATISSIAAAAAFLAPGSASARTISIAFNPANFSNPLTINNTYFPLVAGTTYTYKADTEDGCEVDVTSVTYNTRVIDGVTTRVVHDQVFDGDDCTTAPAALAEDTLDYYAQDNSGNVWYMGEDTFDCEGAGNCTLGEGGWIGGVNGARPGIIMLAHPQVGDLYKQEFLSGVAADQAVVRAVGVSSRMTRPDAYRSAYNQCVVTEESTPLEPGAVEFKTYCAGIGNVLVIEEGGKMRTELTSISGTMNALRFRRPR